MTKCIKILVFLICFCFYNEIYSQTIINELTKNNKFIIDKTKLNFSNFYDRFRLDYDDDNQEEYLLDKKSFDEFKNLIKLYSIKNTTWNKIELESNIYLIDTNKKYLEIDSVKFYLDKKNTDTKLKKDFISKIRNYNSEAIEWRIFPLYISDIIYNKNNDSAIIVVKEGNDHGEIQLYKKQNEVWRFIGNITTWVY